MKDIRLRSGVFVCSSRPGPRRIPELGLVCDVEGTPDPVRPAASVRHWVAETSVFSGTVEELDRTVEPVSGRVTGTSRLAVADGRIFVVLTPRTEESPLLVISVDLDDVRVRHGRGIVRHRGERWVTFSTERWTLRMSNPHRVLHSPGVSWPTGRLLSAASRI